jgi:hypothetical protein
VRITLYGLQNNAALDFVDCVLQYSLDTNNFGIMNNMAVVADAKRPLPGLQAIAQKKVITFQVSYYQQRVANIARQLIRNALPIKYIFEKTITAPVSSNILTDSSGQAITDSQGQPITSNPP